ncbi:MULTISPECIES: peptide deformylase [unclassified Streptomyces]|uniref:peptide deformylase n=1 Tax=unclassified Streptomyces TaxID=2593676 RepID=UPI001EFC08A8|nr:peptide deformylase [Streptomyces sp. MnatMP-M77]
MLPNPKVTGRSGQLDEQYEGCLSFFDIRGLIPRPLKITVETTTLTGETVTTVCKFGLACLIHHLDGRHAPPACAPRSSRSPLRNTDRPAGPGYTSSSRQLHVGSFWPHEGVLDGLLAIPRWRKGSIAYSASR